MTWKNNCENEEIVEMRNIYIYREICRGDMYLHVLKVLLFLKHFVVQVTYFVVTKISTNMAMSKYVSNINNYIIIKAFSLHSFTYIEIYNLQAK